MAPVKQRNSQRNIIVTVVILVALGILGYLVFPLIMQQFQAADLSSSGIVYKVDGTAEQAVVTYTEIDGRISAPKGVDLPWTSPIYNIKSKTIVVLTAAAVGQGTVRCTIMIGGRVMDTNMADPFIDKAICGGFTK